MLTGGDVEHCPGYILGTARTPSCTAASAVDRPSVRNGLVRSSIRWLQDRRGRQEKNATMVERAFPDVPRTIPLGAQKMADDTSRRVG